MAPVSGVVDKHRWKRIDVGFKNYCQRENYTLIFNNGDSEQQWAKVQFILMIGRKSRTLCDIRTSPWIFLSPTTAYHGFLLFLTFHRCRYYEILLRILVKKTYFKGLKFSLMLYIVFFCCLLGCNCMEIWEMIDAWIVTISMGISFLFHYSHRQ